MLLLVSDGGGGATFKGFRVYISLLFVFDGAWDIFVLDVERPVSSSEVGRK